MTTTSPNAGPSKCAALGCAWPESGSQCPDCGAELLVTATEPENEPEPEPRQYVIRFADGTLMTGPASKVGRILADVSTYGDAGPLTLWTWGALPGFAPVTINSTTGPWDDEMYADVRVELVGDDGSVLDVTGYRLDGAS